VAGAAPVCQMPTSCGDQGLECAPDQLCVADLRGDAVQFHCEFNICLSRVPDPCVCARDLCNNAHCSPRDNGEWIVCNYDVTN